jgi:hypothetical protein
MVPRGSIPTAAAHRDRKSPEPERPRDEEKTMTVVVVLSTIPSSTEVAAL